MKRMKLGSVLTAGTALGLAAPCMAQTAKPNVLFIAVDDLKPVLGCYGDPVAVTPNLDRLAQSGYVFQSAYCQAAICGPTRASLLTGLRPDTTRIMNLETKIRSILPDVITLPQHFAAQGYQMAGMGKIFDGRSVINNDADKSFNGSYFNPKFKKRYFEPGNSEAEDKLLAQKKNFWDIRVSLTDRGVCSNEVTKDGSINLQAIEQLKKLSAAQKTTGKPFFLAVGYDRPHLPFNAPEKYWKLYDNADFGLLNYTGTRDIPAGAPSFAPTPAGTELAAYGDFPKNKLIGPNQARELIQGYYACVSFVDELIGELLTELKNQGQDGNTIIVLWGDHGWHLGDHNGWWAKHSNYEQATRAPLMICYPDAAKPGTVIQQVVEFVDIYPTLCELAGLPMPVQPDGLKLQGRSLKSLMENPASDWENSAFSQYPRNGMMGHSIRTARYRYTGWFKRTDILDPKTEEKAPAYEELYDYETDPLETRSLVNNAEYQTRLDELRQKLVTGIHHTQE
jgi:iduronate 2-sulfatase